jgi:hypothetical protein
LKEEEGRIGWNWKRPKIPPEIQDPTKDFGFQSRLFLLIRDHVNPFSIFM